MSSKRTRETLDLLKGSQGKSWRHSTLMNLVDTQRLGLPMALTKLRTVNNFLIFLLKKKKKRNLKYQYKVKSLLAKKPIKIMEWTAWLEILDLILKLLQDRLLWTTMVENLFNALMSKMTNQILKTKTKIWILSQTMVNYWKCRKWMRPKMRNQKSKKIFCRRKNLIKR